jgi:NADH-quinone oxidoreductase subunit N
VTTHDVILLTPLLALGGTVILVMVVAAFTRRHGPALWITVAGLAVSSALVAVPATRSGSRQATSLLIMDGYALFFIVLLCVTTAAVALLSYAYMKGRGDPLPEYYLLLTLALFGSATLAASTHFASFFLGLEILSVSLYALIAYPRRRPEFVEAGVKYLILGGVTSATLLFGMALVYVERGTMTVQGLLAARASGSAALLVTGLGLIMVGVGFKLALVPFHMWTPDIYQAAPAPVTAFIATVSKGAMVALLLRYVGAVGVHQHPALYWTLYVVAIASMAAGNLLALRQDNVKRILAYSSIAHLGYLLVPFCAAGRTAATAIVFYVVAYTVTNLAAFGIVSVLSTRDHEADQMDDYRGLGQRRPWLAATFAASLFSLAGIPLTVGFVGKFYLLTAGTGASIWALAIVLVLTSTIGLYYYTRIIVAMYVQKAAAPAPAAVASAGTPLPDVAAPRAAGATPAAAGGWAAPAKLAGASVLAVTAGVLFWLGVYPAPLIRLIEHVTRTLPH